MAPVAQGMLLSSSLRRAVAVSAATTSAANIAGQLQGSVASVDNVISFVLAPTGVVVFRLPGHRVVFVPTPLPLLDFGRRASTSDAWEYSPCEIEQLYGLDSMIEGE